MNLSRDPQAALLVESGEEYSQLKSALTYATAEIVKDRDAVVDMLVKINTKGREQAGRPY